MHACMYACACTHMCVCVHVCAHVQGCVHAHVRACGGGCMHVCVSEECVCCFYSCIISALKTFSEVGLHALLILKLWCSWCCCF